MRYFPFTRLRSLNWLLAGVLGLAWPAFVAQQAAAQAEVNAEGEVLTRGPVHEAFAEQVQLNPGPSALVPKEPPAPIEELPPDEKPAGDNVAWIPGYWAWDEERDDFLWVSGLWRVVPEGMQWIPGYWAQAEGGYQWVPGTWTAAASAEVETVYYPAPPASLENGPTSPAPGADQVWASGYWNWAGNRYVWRPGYWYQARPNVMWIPPRYLWSPSGYLYAPGYWDYEFNRRGLLFAPVYFPRGVYTRPGFSYGPSVWLNVGGFSFSLFARPSYRHYYFGDYYAPNYAQVGYQPWYKYRGGYDPAYAYYRHHHRHDRDWDDRMRREYDHRRDNPNSRPPRTYQALVAQTKTTNITQNNITNVVLAATLNDYSKVQTNVSNRLTLQKVDKAERDRERQTSRQLQELREQRVKLEKTAAANLKAGSKTGVTAGAGAGIKLALPKSPVTAGIVGRTDVGVNGRQPQPKGEAPKVEPPKVDPPKVDPPKVDPPKLNPPKANPPKVDPPKVDPPKVEPPKVDPPKLNPPKANPPKVDPPKLNPPKVDPPKVEPPKVDPPKLNPPKANPPKVDPPKLNPPKVAPPKFEPPKVAPPKIDPPKVAPPVEIPKVAPPKVDIPKVAPPSKVEIPKVAPPRVNPPRVETPKVERPQPRPEPRPEPRPNPQPRVERPKPETPKAPPPKPEKPKAEEKKKK